MLPNENPTKKQPISVYGETTPNPASLKFVVNKALTKTAAEFKNIDEAKPSPLAQELFKFHYVKEIFIAENWTEEQRMIAGMCDEFVAAEITPNIERMDSMEEGFMSNLMEKAGELGLLGMSVPEELGGMGVDFKTSGKSELPALSLIWFAVIVETATGVFLSSAKSIIPLPIITTSSKVLSEVKVTSPKLVLPLNFTNTFP